jgi:hypothetical protein
MAALHAHDIGQALALAFQTPSMVFLDLGLVIGMDQGQKGLVKQVCLAAAKHLQRLWIYEATAAILQHGDAEWTSPSFPDTFNDMMCSGDINDEDKKELHGRVQT